MTKLLYPIWPDLYESHATITMYGNDDRGDYITLDKTLFYPQGGGQPADKGIITIDEKTLIVKDVRQVGSDIRHYVECDETLNTNAHGYMRVDKDLRFWHSKYHTAGHLIAAVVEKTFPELLAVKGHQFPGEAFVEFNGVVNGEPNFLERVTNTVMESIQLNAIVHTTDLSDADMEAYAQSLPYELPKDKSLRVCYIEGFPPTPCGGTHVRTLKALESINIHKYRCKKGKIKIYYEMLE